MEKNIQAHKNSWPAQKPSPKNTRTGFWFIAALSCVFVGLRLVYLGSTFLFIDDVLAFSTVEHIPWSRLIPDCFAHLGNVTNAIFPTILLDVIKNLFGPHIVLLRLPSVVVAAASFYYLYKCCARLFPNAVYGYLPLVLMTFSIPSVLYAQQIHREIWYFFTTTVQIYYFLKIAQGLGPHTSRRRVFFELGNFTLISLILVLANDMSVLIYAMLAGAYIIMAIEKQVSIFKAVKKKDVQSFLYLVAAFFPLLVLAFWRMSHGHYVRTYLQDYYVSGFGNFFWLFYDFLTYHFNFVFNTRLYLPLAPNWLALPFVLVFILGAIFFVTKNKMRTLAVIWCMVLFFLAIYIKALPFGGVRHSLILAPFAFICLGYGLEAMAKILSWRGKKPGVIIQIVAISLAVYAMVLFSFFGTQMYEDRKSRIDLRTLVDLAEKHNVKTIMGFCDTYKILYMMSRTRHNILEKSNIQYAMFTPQLNKAAKEPYFLVSYRQKFNHGPKWPPVTWKNPVIPRLLFYGKNIIPIVEDQGPLDIKTMGSGSIYFPLNGFFVYLIEPA